ncbi:MAG: hypothetical protein PHG25_01450 [Candidatus Pacebacteria bacterium]|nr:hypothetical protein [Candidatus Paceibacterota bacterium]
MSAKLCQLCPEFSTCTRTQITEHCPPHAQPPAEKHILDVPEGRPRLRLQAVFTERPDYPEPPWDSKEGEYR